MSYQWKTISIVAIALTAACGPSTAKGDEMAQAGDLEGAASVYRQVYEKKITNKVVLVKLARTLFQLNTSRKEGGQEVPAAEWKETFEMLERARNVEPVPPEVDPVKDFELADSAFEAGRAFAEEGKHQEAVKLLIKAKGHGRSGAKIEEYLARSHLAAGDRKGAVEASLKAIEESTTDGELMREAALVASEMGGKEDCHQLMLVAENLAPKGFRYFTFKEVKQLCSRSYFFLTTGLLETVFTVRKMDALRIKEWSDDESLMTKNWIKYQKRHPEEVMKEDKPYFLRILFHLYVTHGMAHVLLCEFDTAKRWWSDAEAMDKTRFKAPSNVSEASVQDELSWPQRNIELLSKLTAGNP